MDKYTSDLVERSCAICGGVDFLPISTHMRKGPQLTTVVCKYCSLVFTNPVPTEDVYYSFYANDYERYYGRSTASRPQAVSVPAIFETLGRFIDIRSSDYLEIGPGRGHTLYHANKLFQSAKGIEPSTDFTRILVQEHQLKIIHNTFEGYMANATEKVDVVSMFHVLEHIYNPGEGLMRVWEVLRENGLLVIEIPNILKPFRNLDSYFLRFVHLYNFSPVTLRCLLIKFGFEIIYADDGGNNWNAPQNITMIARKSTRVAGLVLPDAGEVTGVIQVLQDYRKSFAKTLRWQWLVFDLTRKPMKYMRRIKYKIKVLVNG